MQRVLSFLSGAHVSCFTDGTGFYRRALPTRKSLHIETQLEMRHRKDLELGLFATTSDAPCRKCQQLLAASFHGKLKAVKCKA